MVLKGVSHTAKKKSAAAAGKAVEKQARAKKGPTRKSRAGELDRRESKVYDIVVEKL